MKIFGSTGDVRLRMSFPQRIVLFFLITFISMIVGALFVFLLTRHGMTTLALRLSTVIQDLTIFVLPPVITAVMVTDRPASFLAVNRSVEPSLVILAVLAMVVGIPAMDALVAWNESITLPESLSGLESWMQDNEEAARQSVGILLGGTSVGDLIVSVLIVGVLAGFSEELFFRGAFQRLMASGRMNPHVAVWLTAFIFSAFHMQFYGFFPRLLLGAYFGYLLWWSRSLWLPFMIHMFNNSLVVYATWHEHNGRPFDSETSGMLSSISFDSPWVVALSVLLTACAVYALRKKAIDNLLKV